MPEVRCDSFVGVDGAATDDSAVWRLSIWLGWRRKFKTAHAKRADYAGSIRSSGRILKMKQQQSRIDSGFSTDAFRRDAIAVVVS